MFQGTRYKKGMLKKRKAKKKYQRGDVDLSIGNHCNCDLYYRVMPKAK
jgi:hypothetical protein